MAIADLSTSNENAIYELGVRHALKPRTTIVIAEKQFKFPFDLEHIVIRHYEHLGTGIDYDEAVRLENELTQAVKTISAGDTTWTAPSTPSCRTWRNPPCDVASRRSGRPAAAPAADADNPTFTVLLEAFRAARKKGDFVLAKMYVEKLRESRKDDPYLIQQQALATYKSRQPNAVDALKEAQADPRSAQAAHERRRRDARDCGARFTNGSGKKPRIARRSTKASGAYERAFVMKLDYYTGINYAFMLDDRARIQTDPDEATADHVIARRVRRRLLDIVDAALDAMPRDGSGKVAGHRGVVLARGHAG